jgi:1,4-dihydroxy-2-naphthoate octaprenyltransferase
VTQEASYKTLMMGGFACLIISVLCGIPLVLHGGFPILVLGIVSAVLAYAYTGGPFALSYLGLGELFVFLFFGLAAIGGTFYLQVGSVSTSSLIAGSQIGLLAVVMIAINNYRDMNQDVKTKKKTLAVRFGSNFMKAEITFCLLAPFILGFHWLNYEMPRATYLPLATLPLAFFIILKVIRTKPSVEFNKFLAQSGALLMLFGLALSSGIYLS